MGLLHRRQVRTTELRRCTTVTNQFPALYRNRFILTAWLLYDNLLISTIIFSYVISGIPKSSMFDNWVFIPKKRVENDELID